MMLSRAKGGRGYDEGPVSADTGPSRFAGD